MVLGTYVGGAGLNMTYGRTIIDGTGIRARTIGADRIQANSITANEVSTGRLITASAQIDQGIINTAHINSASILDAFIQNLDASKITTGQLGAAFIQIGGVFASSRNCIEIEGRSGYHTVRYRDGNQVTRVELGQNGPNPNLDIDGLTVRDRFGKVIFHANGFGVQVIGTDNLLGEATYGAVTANSNTLGWASLAGGKIIVNALCMAAMGYTFQDPNGRSVAVSYTFDVRMRLINHTAGTSGTVFEGQMGGAGGSTISIPFTYAFAAPAGTSLQWVIESNTGSGYQPFGGSLTLGYNSTRCQITAVEYKK